METFAATKGNAADRDEGENTAVVFIRGGNWNNGSNDGPFTLNLNWGTGNTNNNVGFRCAWYSSKGIYINYWPERSVHGFSGCAKTATALLPSSIELALERENMNP